MRDIPQHEWIPSQILITASDDDASVPEEEKSIIRVETNPNEYQDPVLSRSNEFPEELPA